MTKEEILALAKKNGVELAEVAAEDLAKKLGHFAMDLVKEVVAASENKIDDMVLASVESTVREAIDKIDITL